jgi:hypothetical protein
MGRFPDQLNRSHQIDASLRPIFDIHVGAGQHFTCRYRSRLSIVKGRLTPAEEHSAIFECYDPTSAV